jgi:hypothetical protein
MTTAQPIPAGGPNMKGLHGVSMKSHKDVALDQSAPRYFFSPSENLYVGNSDVPMIARDLWIYRLTITHICNLPYNRRDDTLEGKPEKPHIHVRDPRTGEEIDTGLIQDTIFAAEIQIRLEEAYGPRGGKFIQALNDVEPDQVARIRAAIWSERPLGSETAVEFDPSERFAGVPLSETISFLEQVARMNVEEQLSGRLADAALEVIDELVESCADGIKYCEDRAAAIVTEMGERAKPGGQGRATTTNKDRELFTLAGLPVPSYGQVAAGGMDDKRFERLLEVLAAREQGRGQAAHDEVAALKRALDEQKEDSRRDRDQMMSEFRAMQTELVTTTIPNIVGSIFSQLGINAETLGKLAALQETPTPATPPAESPESNDKNKKKDEDKNKDKNK